jgi:hypothetical protein
MWPGNANATAWAGLSRGKTLISPPFYPHSPYHLAGHIPHGPARLMCLSLRRCSSVNNPLHTANYLSIAAIVMSVLSS